MGPSCPNCGRSFEVEEEGLSSLAHRDSGCILAALVGVVIERESCPVPSDEIVSKIDADRLWNRLGPIVNDLEEQIVKEQKDK